VKSAVVGHFVAGRTRRGVPVVVVVAECVHDICVVVVILEAALSNGLTV
jgi:hypothetical protein